MSIVKIQDLPEWSSRNKYGVPFAKLDIKKQIQVLLEVNGRDHLKRDKSVSISTRVERENVVFQCIEQIKGEGFALQTILCLSQKHVCALLDRWERENLSPSTIQKRISILRWLTEAAGKPGMVMSPERYGLAPEAVRRTYVATVDKSWTSHGVDIGAVIKRVSEVDAWCGIQLEMIGAFGLRMAEGVMMKPHASDHGQLLRVEEGTKGGRSRVVAIESPQQRDVLDRAKAFAQRSPTNSLVPPLKKPATAIRRLRYMCEKFGVTKAEMGVTTHGLRHQFANDKYERIAMHPSAVRGGTPMLDRELDIKARTQVTQDLGHARLSITPAYTGARKMGRPSSYRNNPIPPSDEPDGF